MGSQQYKSQRSYTKRNANCNPNSHKRTIIMWKAKMKEFVSQTGAQMLTAIAVSRISTISIVQSTTNNT
jgi:hypothetical protein